MKSKTALFIVYFIAFLWLQFLNSFESSKSSIFCLTTNFSYLSPVHTYPFSFENALFVPFYLPCRQHWRIRWKRSLKTEVFENDGRWFRPRDIIVFETVPFSGVHTRTRKQRFNPLKSILIMESYESFWPRTITDWTMSRMRLQHWTSRSDSNWQSMHIFLSELFIFNHSFCIFLFYF